MTKGELDVFIRWILGGLIFLAVLYFFPWGDITWGRIVMKNEGVISVTGYAESNEKNQIAQYSAGVNAINDVKEVAVNEVNTKIAALIKSLKDFGISEDDIQTQQISVYQMQENIDPSMVGRGGVKLGQWNAGNTISITLRDVEKASELSDILTKSGANNVFGPNFQLDSSNKADDSLLNAAVADARSKAEMMAVASGAKLGRVVSIVEGGQAPVYPMMYATAKAEVANVTPVEAGTSKVSKTVTVVFGLR